jgi:DNA-binding protein HU-beta
MTKAELIKNISIETGIIQENVSPVVLSFMNIVKKTVKEKKENIYLRGFGTFKSVHRAEKKARNISKGTTVIVPAQDKLVFKASKN